MLLKMPSLSFQSLACFNEMYSLALQCAILLWFPSVEFHSIIFISRLWCFERRTLPPGRNSDLADILKQVLFQATKRCTLLWTEFNLMKAYCIYLVKETHNTSPITLQPLEVNTQKAISTQSDPLFGHKNGPTLSFPSLFH